MMVRDQDWQARVELQGLSSQKICSSIKKFEDFIENREYQKGKWIAQLFDSRINSDLSTSDIIDVLLRNTRNRTIGYYGKYIIAVIFPVIFLFIVFADWCERQGSTYQMMEPGPQNIAELDNLLEKGARYFDIKTNDEGEVLSISTKYSSLGFEKHIIPADGSSHFTKGGSFFKHYFTLNESYKRISRLAKEGIWFNKGGVADEIIVRSGFTTRYNAFLRFKRIEYLNEDSLNIDTINFQESTSGIFPQFAKSSVKSMISQEFEDWLNQNKIQRDSKLTMDFLEGLPKSELHAHIGGILDVYSQIEVGQAIWNDLNDIEKDEALLAVKELIDLSKHATKESTPWPADWSKLIKGTDNDSRKVGARAAALLVSFEGDSDRLLWCLFPSNENRWSKRVQMNGEYFGGIPGYAGYAVPGDLMGSTVLSFIDSERAVIRKYAEGITKHARSENLSYLEIRLSPTKYRGDLKSRLSFVQSLGRAINSSMDKLDYEYVWRLIISADRSKLEDEDVANSFMFEFEELLRRLKNDSATKTWIAGYDVAGKEKTDDISGELLKRFNSLNLELRLKSTFHAGEQADYNNLRSAYQIHTKRVGHALKLIDDKPLMQEFINSGICLEMCPTSNIEVHGYRVEKNDYYGLKGVSNLAIYPLREYLDAGVKVAICTDNPFISRTSLNNEIVTASDLCLEKPLSFYECLKLIFNAFDNAFIDEYDKDNLVSEAGEKILNHVKSLFENTV
jgi:adenosine deaminase